MCKTSGIELVVPKSCLSEQHGSGLDSRNFVVRAERGLGKRSSILTCRTRRSSFHDVSFDNFLFFGVGNAIEIDVLAVEIYERDFRVTHDVFESRRQTTFTRNSDHDRYEFVTIHKRLGEKLAGWAFEDDASLVERLEIVVVVVRHLHVGERQISRENRRER